MSHDPDNCFCGEDFIGQCPCPCPKCQARSIDPVAEKREQAGAATLLAMTEMLDDRQWQEYLRWCLIEAPGCGHYFPRLVDARLEVRYAMWDTLTEAQKLRHEAELMIREELDQRIADAEALYVRQKRNALNRYLTRMRRLR